LNNQNTAAHVLLGEEQTSDWKGSSYFDGNH
jgi:hypothetical protein